MQDSHTSKPEMNWGCQNYGHKNIKDQPGHHTSGSTLGDTSASCRSCNPFQNLTSGNYWGSGWWEMLGHQTLKLVTRCLMIIPFFCCVFPVVSIRIPAEGVQLCLQDVKMENRLLVLWLSLVLKYYLNIGEMSHVHEIVVLARFFDCITPGLCVWSHIKDVSFKLTKCIKDLY